MGEDRSNERVNRRTALQERISSIESRLRRRLMGKLRAAVTGAYDLDDVISSARRRVDAAESQGKLIGETLGELDAYIFKVAERVALESVRREQRRRDRYAKLAPVKEHVDVNEDDFAKLSAAELKELMARLNQQDRTALELWGRGMSQTAVAEVLGISVEAYRSRWRRMRARLQEIAAEAKSDS